MLNDLPYRGAQMRARPPPNGGDATLLMRLNTPSYLGSRWPIALASVRMPE